MTPGGFEIVGGAMLDAGNCCWLAPLEPSRGPSASNLYVMYVPGEIKTCLNEQVNNQTNKCTGEQEKEQLMNG